jgi:predicted amidohydrolase
MQVIAVQHGIEWEKREANHLNVRALLESARPQRGALVVLPEMFSSGFSMNVDAIAEDETKPTERFLCELARSMGVTVVAGVVSRDASHAVRGRNEALAIAPDGTVAARYAKLHPFTPVHENDHYVAGDHIVTFRWGAFTVSPLVCYDLRFPEAFRGAARRGAQLFTVIASWPEPRIAHWVTLLQARAIENQAYVVGVNRVGDDPANHYTGRSMIIDPSGAVLADAGERETCVAADVDPRVVAEHRESFPYIRDMRDDLMV